jgi:hypothetical protein
MLAFHWLLAVLGLAPVVLVARTGRDTHAEPRREKLGAESLSAPRLTGEAFYGWVVSITKKTSYIGRGTTWPAALAPLTRPW